MILVTGGTGLVGSHVLYKLCCDNKSIRAIHRKSSNIDLVKKIFFHYSDKGEELFQKIEWLEGDINDVVMLEEAMKSVTEVYHCAALVSFNKRDYENLMKFNVEGTANVVNACLDAKVRKLVYVSSVAALGKGEENKLLTENDHWTNEPDISNYSISKHKAEQEVWRGIEEGLNAIMVNPCVILGPHDWNRSSTAAFKTVYKGLKFYTSGSNAVVDVRVVAEAMIQLMKSDITAQRFLIISENLTVKEVISKMAYAFGKPAPKRKVSKFTMNVARILESIKSKFSRREPRITKETTSAAFKQYAYSNEKIKQLLPDFNCGTADEAVKNAVAFFTKYYIHEKR